ncbi:MAG: DMT family transporter [Actinobacteria bacterium]|nr:DMT family transporter [Actinomycetota bacterium]
MKQKLLLYFGLLLTTAVWGGSFVVMKDSLERQDVISFLATRFLIAGLLMLAYRPYSLMGLGKTLWIRATVLGFLLAAGFIFQSVGLTKTTVSSTGFITGLYLVFTPLISWLLLKRHILRLQLLAVFIATLGLYLIAYNGIEYGFGEFLVLISAVLFAIQIVAVGEWSNGKNAYPLALIQILVAALLFVMISFKDGYQVPPDGSVWIAILFTALFATFLGFLIQVKAQAIMTATAAGVILAMEVPFAFIFGLYFDNDPLTLRIASGGALVMGAMAMVIWSETKKNKSAEVKND